MRQAGLFRLGEGSRGMCDDKKKVTEELPRKVEEGTKKKKRTRSEKKKQRRKYVFGKVTKMTLNILIVPIYRGGMSTLEQI